MTHFQKELLSEFIQTLDSATGMLLVGVDSLGDLDYILPTSTRMFYMQDGNVKSVPRYTECDHSKIS